MTAFSSGFALGVVFTVALSLVTLGVVVVTALKDDPYDDEQYHA